MALSLKMVYGPEQKAKRLTVVYAQEIPYSYYTHITTQVFNAGKMIARIY